MHVATGAKREMGGTDFKWGGRALKNFIMTHQHTEAKIISPKKEELSRNPTTCFAEP